MPPTTHDEFESAVIKVEFAAIVDGEQVFSEWARPPIAHEGCDLANVLDAIPVDCGAVVVPLGFASWAEAYVPRLLVQHVLVEDGKEEVRDVTAVLTIPHASGLFLRMMHLGRSAEFAPASRIRVRLEHMAAVWGDICSSDKLSTYFVPKKAVIPRQMVSKLNGFELTVRHESLYEATLQAGNKGRIVLLRQLALPEGVEPASDAGLELYGRPAWKMVRRLEMVPAKSIVQVGESMERLADFLDYLGAGDDVKDRYDERHLYLKAVQPIFADIPALEPTAKMSALQKARMADEDMMVDSLAGKIKQALSSPEYRSYELTTRKRLLEWCALLDLGDPSPEVKADAASILLPNLLYAEENVKELFSGEPNGIVVVRHYCSLVDTVLDTTNYYDIHTVQQLVEKLRVSLGRCRNEVDSALSLQQKLLKLVSFWDQEKQEVKLSAQSTAGTEDKAKEGHGRRMTQTETLSLAKMRSHELWGSFLRLLELLKAHNSPAADFVEVQLKSGLPYVRKQLYGEVNVGETAGSPWDMLMEYRFASKHNFELGQLYLGREIMRGEDGVVPDLFANWKAPALLVRQLKIGKVSEIEWEALWAEVMRAKSQPLPNSVVLSFTKERRFTHMEYEHEVAELGGCILEAWGWNLSSVYEGSFQWLLARHFKSIRTVRHLQDKPRKQALTNASWGAYPSLWAAIKSAEENMDLYLQMLPGQICVEGSTSMVLLMQRIKLFAVHHIFASGRPPFFHHL